MAECSVSLQLCHKATRRPACGAGRVGLHFRVLQPDKSLCLRSDDPIPQQSAPETRGIGSVVCLSIADTGCGMDRATPGRVFEPFFTTKGVGSGTGLRFSVVHGVITSHSGTIAVRCKPGEGSEYILSLPA